MGVMAYSFCLWVMQDLIINRRALKEKGLQAINDAVPEPAIPPFTARSPQTPKPCLTALHLGP